MWIYNDYSFFFTSIRCFSSCISFSSPISLEFPLRVSVSFFISILSPYLSDLLLGVFRGASDSDGNVRRKSGIKRLMIGLHLAYSSFRSQAGWWSISSAREWRDDYIVLFMSRFFLVFIHDNIRSTVISRLSNVDSVRRGEHFSNIRFLWHTRMIEWNGTKHQLGTTPSNRERKTTRIRGIVVNNRLLIFDCGRS